MEGKYIHTRVDDRVGHVEIAKPKVNTYDLDRNRVPLSQRGDQLGRIDHDHDLAGETCEQLLAQERAPAPLREVEGGTHLVRPIQHQVEAVVASEPADRDSKGPGEILGRA